MDIRRTRTCERCKATVPIDKVMLFAKDESKNILVCENCGEELKKKVPELKTKIGKLPTPKFVTYFCLRCKYSFRADDSKIGVTYNLHCPYCGRTDKLEMRT